MAFVDTESIFSSFFNSFPSLSLSHTNHPLIPSHLISTPSTQHHTHTHTQQQKVSENRVCFFNSRTRGFNPYTIWRLVWSSAHVWFQLMKTGETSNLGHGRTGIVQIHHEVVLQRRRRCLTGLRHNDEKRSVRWTDGSPKHERMQSKYGHHVDR